MDIQSVKTLLELKAMQTINNSTSVENSSDQFATLLDAVTNANSSVESDLSSTLGSHNLIASLLGGQNNPSANNDQITNYLASFLLAGSANITQSTSTLETYSKDYTSKENFSNFLEGASKYAQSISKASATYNIPEKLLASVMKQESNFNANAVSSAGATGLMQLMPSTAKYLGVKDAKDPDQNIMGGAKYLRQMLDKFDNNISLALAAYNSGPGNVQKYNGIPPFKETQNYVSKVMNYYQA